MNILSASALTVVLLSTAACSSSSPPAAGGNDDAGKTVAVTPDSGGEIVADAGGGTDASTVVVAPVADAAGAVIVVDAGPACNDLAPAAPSVDYSLSDDASPAAATGGAIADGTYYLTGYTIYGAGSVGQGFTANQATSVTLVIAGGSWTQVQVYLIENTSSTVSSDFAVTTSDASVTLTPSCPAGSATTGTFTATATALQLVTNTSGFVVSETFAKQ